MCRIVVPKVARNLGGENKLIETAPIDDSAKQRAPVMTDSITELAASHIPVKEKVTADADAPASKQPVSPLRPASKQLVLQPDIQQPVLKPVIQQVTQLQQPVTHLDMQPVTQLQHPVTQPSKCSQFRHSLICS
ncbi:hypothetical protein TSUD_372770 [Trifolium subterraneum]|uniref:Uncharacterized protein n=1 Tax=Trifolium subterraneum TaxID=3900 RepID=A0A2Z6P941_TRISU|nr:hypothetical protein TSUD_372770 [Trifolium subterraneum]